MLRNREISVVVREIIRALLAMFLRTYLTLSLAVEYLTESKVCGHPA